ncbi:MAG: MFS transporter [Candidatus Uhrbacteria bacterium]|nr:MFS transporter [Pseudomonadota bacterium]
MPWRKLKGFSRLHITPHIPPGLGLLYSNRLIIQFGTGLLGLFFPIFLYEQFGGSMSVLLGYYFIAFLVSFFLMAPGAMIMSRIGLRSSMILAVVGLALWHIPFIFWDASIAFYLLGFVLIMHNIWRMFYWTPFHVEFAEMTKKGERGRTLGTLTSIAAVISIVIPFIAGFVLDQFSYSALFLAASAIVFASLIPLFMVPQVVEKYSFGYWETFKHFFSKKNRRMVTAYTADGIESTVGAVIWPVFIFEILQGNYFEVGALTSLIVLVGVLIRLIMGSWADKHSRHKMLKWGTGLYSIGYVVKMFVDTAFTIFIASTFHNLAMIMMRTPFDVLMYERAADAGHYVDEYTVIREMAICIGRVISVVLMFVLLLFVPLYIAFLVGALATLLMNRLD